MHYLSSAKAFLALSQNSRPLEGCRPEQDKWQEIYFHPQLKCVAKKITEIYIISLFLAMEVTVYLKTKKILHFCKF